ncbi:hypothetical protein RHSIM_Rhsim08G0187000 [Rhododendron simsii]|uniref:Reverse transcriptase zinc-binding domain-containing protein n=1 Tax=Rhododendron simsii TaxID=118357 RepID=A0A834GKI0_RHOSS|nr:hypothetical protein RHSIM_Rhsim08G0187000 [Rhododendron simsii]
MAIQGLIASKSVLVSRGILNSNTDQCPYCNSVGETPNHLLLLCNVARRVWEEASFYSGVWTLWTCRNELVYRNKMWEVEEIADLVKTRMTIWIKGMSLGVSWSVVGSFGLSWVVLGPAFAVSGLGSLVVFVVSGLVSPVLSPSFFCLGLSCVADALPTPPLWRAKSLFWTLDTGRGQYMFSAMKKKDLAQSLHQVTTHSAHASLLSARALQPLFGSPRFYTAAIALERRTQAYVEIEFMNAFDSGQCIHGDSISSPFFLKHSGSNPRHRWKWPWWCQVCAVVLQGGDATGDEIEWVSGFGFSLIQWYPMASEAQPNAGAAVKLGLRKPVILKIEEFGGAGDGGCLEEAKPDGWRWDDDDSVWPF